MFAPGARHDQAWISIGGKIRYAESDSVIFDGAARSVHKYASTASREKRARWAAERILRGVLAAVADADVRYRRVVLAIGFAGD